MAMFYPENWALIKDFDGQPTPAPSNIAARTAQAQGFLDVVSLPALFLHLQVASNSDDDAAAAFPSALLRSLLIGFSGRSVAAKAPASPS